MKKKPAIIFHVVKLTCFFQVVLNSSCSEHNHQINTSLEVNSSATIRPDTLIIKSPVTVLLNSRPVPTVFKVSAKSASLSLPANTNKSLNEVIKETKPFGFFVPMQNYNVEQGLSSSVMFNGCVDKNGNLWFGSIGGGAIKYDGNRFTAFTPATGIIHNGVYYILQDENDNYWFATAGGVSRYDGKSFTNFTTAQGLLNNQVFSVFEDSKKNMWMSTLGGGVSRYDGKSFFNYTTKQGLANNVVYRTIEDNDGNVFCGTDSGVSVLYKNSSSFIYFAPLKKLSVWNTVKDKDGGLWFGSNNGLYHILKDSLTKQRELKSAIEYTTSEGLLSNNINCFMQARDGSFWIGTDAGLSCWEQDAQHPDSFHITNYSKAQGLSNTNVKTILEDSNRNIWIGTLGGGIFRLDQGGKVYTTYTTAQGMADNHVNKIFEDKKNNLWFCTYNGLCSLNADKKNITSYIFSSAEGYNEFSDMLEDKSGNLWFCKRSGGIFCFDAERKYITHYTSAQGLIDDDIISLLMKENGNILAISQDGISCFTGNSFINYTPELGAFNSSPLLDKKGNVWLGFDSGLCRFDSTSFIMYTTKHGLPVNAIFCIKEDKYGNLWLGTGSGLSRFDGKSFMDFTIGSKFIDKGVDDIAVDKQGLIWLGTPKGITLLKSFYQEKGSKDTIRKSTLNSSNGYSNEYLKTHGFNPNFENYNDQTGYTFREVYKINATHDNLIWAAASDKVINFDYTRVYKNPNPLKVFIQGIKVDDQDISWYDLEKNKGKTDSAANIIAEAALFGKTLNEAQRDAMQKKYKDIKFDNITALYSIPVNLVLPYKNNNITFDFAAIEPSKPNVVNYQYILEGYNDDWSIAGNETRADFGNIHEGIYTFKLKAQSPDGIWSNAISYTFKVLPPWYRTWLAYALYILLFLVALWSFVKWRERTLKKEKVILENKVALRTHELKEEKEKVESTLSELKSTQAQLIQSEKMASLGELTAGIAHEIQNPLNFVNNFSDVNKELLAEMKDEMNKGNIDDANAIANDVIDNEEKINHHGKRADAIVKGMLEHSKASTGKKELTDINKLADEYLRLSYHGLRAKDKSFNADFKTDFDESIGKINIVPQDIARVLLNLINNAFYAVNEKKKNADKSYQPAIIVQTKKINNKIEISVEDNGNGIPQKIVDKIFQPFFTTKPTGQGTGLGLSLSYDIVKAHGGEIKVESKNEEGSTFIIQLPLN